MNAIIIELSSFQKPSIVFSDELSILPVVPSPMDLWIWYSIMYLYDNVKKKSVLTSFTPD